MSRVGTNSVLFVICCILLPFVALAEPTFDKYGDLIRPEAEKYSGVIDEIGSEADNGVQLIVINDTKYTVDNDTFYRNKSGGKSSLSRFSTGMVVDYYAIEYLVTNLSVSNDSDEDIEESMKDYNVPVPVQGEIRQEDGVWKN